MGAIDPRLDHSLGFVVGEVFAAHFVAHDVRNWLLAYAGTFMVGIAAGLLTRTKATAGSDGNRQTSKRVVFLIPGITLLAVAASLLYDLLGLYRIQLLVVSIMAALVVIYVIASLGYWGRVATVSSRKA